MKIMLKNYWGKAQVPCFPAGSLNQRQEFVFLVKLASTFKDYLKQIFLKINAAGWWS